MLEAMYFGDIEKFMKCLKGKYGDGAVKRMLQGYRSGITMSFTYYPTINEFMGRKNVQIVIQNYK